MRGQDRAAFGCIVTAREKTTGDIQVFHESGDTVTMALQTACSRIDKLDGSWEVICVSTPASVYRDLQGTRNRVEYGRDHRAGVSYRRVMFHPLERERQMLSRAKRLDLFPSAIPSLPSVNLEPRRWTHPNRGAE